MSTFTEITVEEVQAKLAAGERFRLIDIREPGEYRTCHIAAAELKPLSQMGQWINDLDNRDEDIVLHCHHGVRSERACGFLASYGFTNVKNMIGGIDEWSLRIDPSVPRY
jgi:rhodanese-related sulfurtransferase